tara:strand:- start:2774 stop:3595 length:822 start_codon:yes stop_codon:yes gene_type:complete
MKATAAITLAALTALSTAALAGGPGPGDDDIVLGDANSTATFNNDGQYSWTVDGVEHLYAQEFYFRLPGYNDEQNINTMTMLGQAVQDTNGFSDNRVDSINTIYSDSTSGLEIETAFTLRGSTNGSGAASLAEVISITNTSTSTIFLSFFQYVDFDLGGDSDGDSGMIVDGNIAQQWNDEFALSETVVTPSPTLYQMGYEGDLYDLWENGQIDDLNGDSSLEDDDVAWAFQWNIELEAGQSFLISKNKTIVPTPGTLALLLGAGLISTRRRRD